MRKTMKINHSAIYTKNTIITGISRSGY
uniref:Uncharacterized protein n=1 Tax=Anguilla anguilla TaxID=7936 RepID=A0A0E9W902_ANGAN